MDKKRNKVDKLKEWHKPNLNIYSISKTAGGVNLAPTEGVGDYINVEAS